MLLLIITYESIIEYHFWNTTSYSIISEIFPEFFQISLENFFTHTLSKLVNHESHWLLALHRLVTATAPTKGRKKKQATKSNISAATRNLPPLQEGLLREVVFLGETSNAIKVQAYVIRVFTGVPIPDTSESRAVACVHGARRVWKFRTSLENLYTRARRTSKIHRVHVHTNAYCIHWIITYG